MKKPIFAISGIAAGMLLSLAPIPGLPAGGGTALGILLWAICWWIGGVLPDFITAMVMSVLFIVLCDVPTDVVYRPFSGSSWWLLMSSFGLSYGVARCGLIQRISLLILRIFPATFTGQLLAQLAVGFATAPFIPNMSAKAAVLTPLAMGVSDSIGYDRRGRQATGLFLAMFTGMRNGGPLFISASVLGYAFLSLYPADLSSTYTMLYWFKAALPWFLLVTLGNGAALLLLFRPRDMGEETGWVQLTSPGPMTTAEKKMTAIILSVMALWVTQPIHGIEAHVVSVGGLCVAIGWNVIDRKDFCAGMNWDSLIFVGCTFGIATTFEYLGVNQWVTQVCGTYAAALAGNPCLLFTVLCVTVICLRFIIVTELSLVNILMVLLVPIAMGSGINPWVVGFGVYSVITPWFFLYQNPVYVASYYSVQGEVGNQKAITLYCFVYLLICIVGVLLSIPYWHMTGIFYL